MGVFHILGPFGVVITVAVKVGLSEPFFLIGVIFDEH
jgi:hypothetical protein